MKKIQIKVISIGHLPCEIILDKINNWQSELLELTNVKKSLYFRLADWIKTHPVYAILISSGWAIFLGLIGSLIGKLFE